MMSRQGCSYDAVHSKRETEEAQVKPLLTIFFSHATLLVANSVPGNILCVE
jgi:hypothetical protein